MAVGSMEGLDAGLDVDEVLRESGEMRVLGETHEGFKRSQWVKASLLSLF